MTDKQKLINIRGALRATIEVLKLAPQEGYVPMVKVTAMFVAMEHDVDAMMKQPADV